MRDNSQKNSSLRALDNINKNNDLIKNIKIKKGKKSKIIIRNKLKKCKNSKSLHNINNILTTSNFNNNNSNNKKNIIKTKEKICFSPLYTIINFDAGNRSNNKETTLKYDLYTYDFSDAIKYEKRKFCQIFFISIILKEKIII